MNVILSKENKIKNKKIIPEISEKIIELYRHVNEFFSKWGVNGGNQTISRLKKNIHKFSPKTSHSASEN